MAGVSASVRILSELADHGHLRRPSILEALPGVAPDADRYGGRITAEKAMDRLAQGEPVIVRHPTVGTVSERSEHIDLKAGSRMGLEEYEVHDATRETLLTGAWHGEGVALTSVDELERFNAAEKLTAVPTEHMLSSNERHVAGLLRKFEGGKVFQVALDNPLGGPDQYYSCTGDHSDKNPGLYDLQTRKGGLLGIGTHPDRLTAYEAMPMVMAGDRPIMIRTPDGMAHVLRTQSDLETLDQRYS